MLPPPGRAGSVTMAAMKRVCVLVWFCVALVALLGMPGWAPRLAGTRAAGGPPSLGLQLQPAVDHSMAGRAGAAVVLDVASGQILAHHRLDIAARTLARPGSTVKPFTLMALIRSGRTAPRGLLCKRRVRIAGRQLDCSHPRDPRPITEETALAYSCNFYFSEAGSSIGGDDLVRTLSNVGLTSITGLAPEEAAGSVRPPTNVDQSRLLALGEGNIEVTPLAVASAYRRLAQMRRNDAQGAYEKIFRGLEASAAYGMGRLAQPDGLEVAGKTGTASAQAGWTHAWFAGYAPAASPEIVVVVFLERGRGGADAAPVAGEIFAAYAAARSRK